MTFDIQLAVLAATVASGFLALCLGFVAQAAPGIPGVRAWAAGFGLHFLAFLVTAHAPAPFSRPAPLFLGLEVAAYLTILWGHFRFLGLAVRPGPSAAGLALMTLAVAWVSWIQPETYRPGAAGLVAALALACGVVPLGRRVSRAMTGLFLAGVGFVAFGLLRALYPLAIELGENGARLLTIAPALLFTAGIGLVVMVMQTVVAERRRYAEEARGRARMLARVFESMSQGVVVVDRHGRIQAANPRAAALMGVPPEALAPGAGFADFLRAWAAIQDVGRRELETALESFHSQQHLLFEMPLDEERVVEIRHEPQADGGFLRVLTDITEGKRLERKLRELATTDSLTGLANRRQFEQLGKRELLRAQRFDTPLAAVMIDIDHFKQINDRHGHPAGDSALAWLATVLRDTLRRIDVVGRLGGEEFGLLLPETPAEGARIVAERLREAVARLEVPAPDGPVRLTVSLGVAMADPGDDLDSVMARADRALYRAKQSGRNRVCLVDEARADEARADARGAAER